MKKIKLLSTLGGLTVLTTGLMPLTSCGGSTNVQDIENVDVTVSSDEISTTGGTQTINFSLGSTMKDQTITVSVNNDSSNYVNIEIAESNGSVTLDSEGKGSVKVKFAVEPTASITSKYSLLFQYETNGKTRIISSKVITVKYTAEAPLVKLDWNTCSWADLISAANKGETYFVNAFSKTSMKDFVGLTKSIKLYSNPIPDSKGREVITREVRVIGVNHDSYLDQTTGELTQALLTFEFVELIDAMIWKPDQTKSAYTYRESQVYKHFNNYDTPGGFVWRFKGTTGEVDDIVVENAKPVIKACTEFDYINKQALLGASAMQFFSLSPTELGMSDEEWLADYPDYEMLDEGWAYNYYENATNNHDLRRKKLHKKTNDVTEGEYSDYHTRTVCLPQSGSGETKLHWATCAAGNFGEYQDTAGEVQGLDVAFCI